MGEAASTGTRWTVIVLTVVAIVALVAFARGRAQRGHHTETLDAGVSVSTAQPADG